MSNKFIVFEGLDGSGKTTQAKRLVGALRAMGIAAHYTMEPQKHSRVGALIREMLVAHEEFPHPKMQALLFVADRFSHIWLIEELLKTGHVICDRYSPSTYAYQYPNVSLEYLDRIHEGILYPDYTFYFNIDPYIAIKRLKNSRTPDSMENIENLILAKQKYDEIAFRPSYRFHSEIRTLKVNMKTEDEVFYDICHHLRQNGIIQ